MNGNTAIVPGSLSDVAQSSHMSLAESFLSCDTIVLVDVSGSMEAHDSRGGQRRYDVACAELAKLQASNSGKIGVIAFSDEPIFVPGGVPPLIGSGTALHKALRFARVADVAGIRFVIISDGIPDSQEDALHEAAQYHARIDCIHVGPESDRASRAFLERLASAHGGKQVTAANAAELAAAVERLMLSA